MISVIQYLHDTVERDYIENKALIKVLEENHGYDAASWFNRELCDTRKKRIVIAKFLDILDEYQKECRC